MSNQKTSQMVFLIKTGPADLSIESITWREQTHVGLPFLMWWWNDVFNHWCHLYLCSYWLFAILNKQKMCLDGCHIFQLDEIKILWKANVAECHLILLSFPTCSLIDPTLHHVLVGNCQPHYQFYCTTVPDTDTTAGQHSTGMACTFGIAEVTEGHTAGARASVVKYPIEEFHSEQVLPDPFQ